MASEIGEARHHGRRRAGLLAEGVELPPGQGDGAVTLLAGRGRRARADGLLARRLHRVDGATATARRRPRRRDDGYLRRPAAAPFHLPASDAVEEPGGFSCVSWKCRTGVLHYCLQCDLLALPLCHFYREAETAMFFFSNKQLI